MSVFYRLLLILIGRAIVMVGLMPLAAFVKAGTAHLLGGAILPKTAAGSVWTSESTWTVREC
ncbi:hypothetical protein [Ruminococcus sp.]|uniref:hypothetical protein n=1 Tax=Ruminococcus sp. TaxID=41978 RepID=UPI002B90E04C|nr:hypothetical protein [Ruminococcus sp.]HOH86942.1 hypothetical protein [Ruminococcus sp.]